MSDSREQPAPADNAACDPSNPKWYRQVLGQYPTGVCVITATPANGRPAGMAVGSFTSVSLDPPLVAFFPDRGSTSWPRIREAGRFCVNILAADQEHVCRRFAAKTEDKFIGLAHRMSPLGSPIIDGTVAWIDCAVHEVFEAGDHYIVVGRVHALQIESGNLPLLFFQGGYGQFSSLSLAAPDPLGTLTEQLRYIDLIRPEMENLAQTLSARCMATARVDDELVIAAGAGAGSARKGSAVTFVGQRLPFMPPTGAVHAAWNGEAHIERWLRNAGAASTRDVARQALARVRDRGYSLGVLTEAQRDSTAALERRAAESPSSGNVDLRARIEHFSYDPPDLTPEVLKNVRMISAPVFGPKGEVVLGLTLYEFPKPPESTGVRYYIDRVVECAARATRALAHGAASPPA